MTKLYTLILSLLFIILSVETACVPIGQSDAALFLEDLAAGKNESRLKTRTSTPTSSSINYQIQGHNYRADLYRPSEAPLAGMVLIPGVAQHGKDDPRLIAFATTLARSRFMVLVPDIPNLRNLKVQAQDSLIVAHAFTYLVSHSEFPAPGQAGIGALSYAVGPAILAALKPRIREDVDFILSVGGYYDVEQVITFFTTGYYRDNNEWQYLDPNEYGKWVFVLSNVDHLTDVVDKKNFLKIAQRKLKNPNASIDDLVTNLSTEASSILTLLQNKNPADVPNLIRNLPDSIRAELNALNLADKDLAQLKARLLLLHGTDDDIIPYTESIALANAVMKGQAELFLIDGLAHVNIHPEKLDQWTMVKAIDALLKVRELES